MHRRRPSTDAESGAAVLEFILVGLLLLVPLVYVVLALGSIQSQSLGVEAGSRHVARAIALSADADDARERTDRVLAAVVDAYGIDGSTVSVTLTCAPAEAECPSAGATIVVTIRAHVRLPLVPPVLGIDRVAHVPVEGSSAQKVSRFWGVQS